MSKLTELEFLHVDHSIFLSGTNLGNTLPHPRITGVQMVYSEDTKHAYVRYNGKTMRIPEAKICGMIEQSNDKPAKKPQVDTTQRNPVNAQVETPYGHVHAGLGHGKTK